MTRAEYYSTMCGGMGDTFEEILPNWRLCFSYFLLPKGFEEPAIKDLFFEFEMDNWKALHKENTRYAGYSKEELIESFKAECSYISDRMSYDRLFRAHWLFRQAFRNELNVIRFPSHYRQ